MSHDLFESQRLRFRALAENDLPLFHAWWNDPDVARYQIDGTIHMAQEETNVAMIRAWFENSASAAGFVIERKEDREPIGFCNLWGASVKNRDAELAILVAKEHWGQGLGTEALRLLVRYGFTEMNLHRIHLTVHGFNERAIRAYEKVGFHKVGRAREALFRDGRWHDMVLMDQLQHEFQDG